MAETVTAPSLDSSDQLFQNELSSFQQERSRYLGNQPVTADPVSTAKDLLDQISPSQQSSSDYVRGAADMLRNADQWSNDPNTFSKPSEVQDLGYQRYFTSHLFKQLGYNPERDNENIYHENQGTLNRLGNSAANLIGKTISYAAQNVGFLGGAPAALLTGNISNMTDNFIVKASDILKNYTQDKFPIYKGDKYTKGTIWDKLASTDWWLDDGMDRVALTAGMLAPALLGGAGLSLAGGKLLGEEGFEATGLLTKQVPKLANMSAEDYGILSKTFVPKLFGTALKSNLGTAAANALEKYASALNYAEFTAWNVIGQAGLNGSETQAGIKKTLREERDKGQNFLSDAEIDLKAAGGAKASFWQTVPLTLAGSLIEVPAMFGVARGGKSILNKLYNAKTTEELLTAAKTSAPTIGKMFLTMGITGLEHGQNESGQVAISRYNEDSRTGKNDTRGTIPGIWGDYLDNINDPNGQNNIALGTIQGVLMSLFGYGKGHILGEYKAKDQQQASYLDVMNQARLKQRLYTGDLNLKADGKTVISKDGTPAPDEDKIVQGGLSLKGLQDSMERRKRAIEDGNLDAADKEDHDNLAGFAYNFFPDPAGMEHLQGWLALDKKNNELNPDYERINGITPEQQYQNNLSSIKDLKKAYDDISSRPPRVSDLDIDPSDKEAVKLAKGFLGNQQRAQYHAASSQIFFGKKLGQITSDLSALQSKSEIARKAPLTLDKKGNNIYKPIPNPSSPDEENYNELLERKEPVENALQVSRAWYKLMINKSEMRKAFKEHVDFMNPITREADKATKKQQVAQNPVTQPEPKVVDDSKTPDILPEHKGKVVFMTSGLGKTFSAKLHPDELVDGDVLLQNLLKSKGIPVTDDPQNSGLALWRYLKDNPDKSDALIQEYQDAAKEEVSKGKTVLTASKYLRPIADKAYLTKDVTRVGKVLRERGQTNARYSAEKHIQENEAEIPPEKIVPVERGQYAEDILTGITPVPDNITKNLKEEADKLNSLEELDTFEKKLSKLVREGKLTGNEMDELLRDKRPKVIKTISLDNINPGDKVIMHDRTTFGIKGYATVVSKSPEGVKLRKGFGKSGKTVDILYQPDDIELVYNPEMKEEDITPPVTDDVKSVTKANVEADPTDQEGTDDLVDKARREALGKNEDELGDELNDKDDC